MKNLTVIGLKLLAIYVLVQILSLSQVIPSYFMYDQINSVETISVGVIFLTYWIFFGFLFFGSEKISKFIVPKQADESVAVNDYQKLAAVLFSTVGLLIIYGGFEMLFTGVSSIININATQPDFLRYNKQYYFWIPFFRGGIQILVGLIIFIGGKKLAGWWTDFRNWT